MSFNYFSEWNNPGLMLSKDDLYNIYLESIDTEKDRQRKFQAAQEQDIASNYKAQLGNNSYSPFNFPFSREEGYTTSLPYPKCKKKFKGSDLVEFSKITGDENFNVRKSPIIKKKKFCFSKFLKEVDEDKMIIFMLIIVIVIIVLSNNSCNTRMRREMLQLIIKTEKLS